jgi:uncharacterized protein YjdB
VYTPTAGVQLSATSKELFIGESFVLTANTLPLATTDGKIEWSVSNENVVKRNADGSIIAVGVGEANVTAKSVNGGYSLSCKVKVKAVPVVESITLSNQSITMFVGESHALIAIVLPADVWDKTLQWSSSNTKVASVDANGVIKAVGYGNTIITVSSATNSSVKATCEVMVYAHTTGVQISASALTLTIGEQSLLTAITLPLNISDGKIEWHITNESVVSRGTEDTIVALSEGVAEVIAKSVDGGHEAKCVVTVKGNSGLNEVNMNESVSYKIYNIQGVKLNSLEKGVNIIRFENGIIQKLIVK